MNLKKLFKNKLFLIICSILLVAIIVIVILLVNKDEDKKEVPLEKDTSGPIIFPDESYFVKENELDHYKLEVDHEQVVAGLTFYDFKMKDYKNGFQKIELMVRNDGNKKSKNNKKFMIEPTTVDGTNDVIVDVSIKSLKPGESTKLEGHFAWDIKGIVGFRVKEYLLDD